MAHNLSSNQQYLLAMVQQNNPEILSKFLNEQDGERKKPSLVKDQTDAEKIARETKEADRQASAAEHYQDLFANLPSDVTQMTPQQAAEVAMYKSMTKKGKIGGEAGKKLKAAVETDTSGVRETLPTLDDETLRMISQPAADETRVPSTQSKVALRYAKKADENKLPFGKRPISPFYKTTRDEFAAAFGRDFDASGGATPANMRGLVNIKTNLAGRLKDIETGWQDKMAWEAQLKAGEPFAKRLAPNSKEFYKQEKQRMDATWKAKGKAEFENPVHDYVASDFDVPEIRKPGEPEGTGRTLPTKPVDTNRTTEWIDRGMHDSLRTQWNDPSQKEIMRGQGFNPDSMLNTPVEGGGEMRIDWTKGPGCQGPFCQASNLSGKSVNQKISRIA